MVFPVDDIAMTVPEPVLRQEGISLWRQIANRLQHDIGYVIRLEPGRTATTRWGVRLVGA